MARLIVRRTGACLLVLVAAFAAFPLAESLNPSLLDHSLANSREIDLAFRRAEAAIAGFEKQNGRLPTAEEMARLDGSSVKSRYHVSMNPSGFDQCDSDPAVFKMISTGSYVLEVWRGEWSECYAPALRKSTLPLRREDYTVFGSVFADLVALPLIILLCLAASVRLWMARSPATRKATSSKRVLS